MLLRDWLLICSVDLMLVLACVVLFGSGFWIWYCCLRIVVWVLLGFVVVGWFVGCLLFR